MERFFQFNLVLRTKSLRFLKENDANFTTINLNEKGGKGIAKNILLTVKQSYSNLLFTRDEEIQTKANQEQDADMKRSMITSLARDLSFKITHAHCALRVAHCNRATAIKVEHSFGS